MPHCELTRALWLNRPQIGGKRLINRWAPGGENTNNRLVREGWVLAECRAAGLDTEAIQTSLEPPESRPFGKIIAVAELVDCQPAEDLTPDPAECAFGDYVAGRFGWQLVRLPDYVPARGLQGLWPMMPETMGHLEKALSASPRQDSR